MQESSKRLSLAWGAMSAATGAAVFIGHAGAEARLDALSIAALLGLAFFKASVLLSHYLELRRASGWNSAFRLAVFFLLATIFALTVVARG
jgi:hypothetical protein